jgi:hypothetical protein
MPRRKKLSVLSKIGVMTRASVSMFPGQQAPLFTDMVSNRRHGSGRLPQLDCQQRRQVAVHGEEQFRRHSFKLRSLVAIERLVVP